MNRVTELKCLSARVQRTCSECGEPMQAVCWPCKDKHRSAALEAWKQPRREGIDKIVATRMQFLGLGKRELPADLNEVPFKIKSLLPPDTVQSLLDGNRPERGFGLVGGTGGGKTMTIAALLKAGVAKLIAEGLEGVTELPNAAFYDPDWARKGRFTWVNWPLMAENLKGMVGHGQQAEAEDTVQSLMRQPLLVLDDIGLERIRGDYTQDFAASQLIRLILHRDRECLPILWTSNVSLPDLVSSYGGAAIGRLRALAPEVDLPKLPDLRLLGG